MTNPILLWKPLGDVPPEPEMIIEYEGLRYAMPYTLLHSVVGWLRMGASGSNALDGPYNTIAALDTILKTMQSKCYPVAPEVIEQYKAQGVYSEPSPMPTVTDYRNIKPLTREELAETSELRNGMLNIQR